MARNPATPSESAPYQLSFTAGELDLTQTTNGALQFVSGELDRTSAIQFFVSGDNASATATWQLTLVDYGPYNQSAGRVVAMIPFTSTSSTRRTLPSNASGNYVHTSDKIDLRGFRSENNQRRWFLALETLSAGSLVVIEDWTPFNTQL